MILKIFLLIMGILLSSISMFFIVLYLNLLNMGYDFTEYIIFIFSRVECYLIFIGVLFLYLVFRKGKRNEIHL